MAKLSQIVPKDVYTVIPFMFYDETTGDMIQDKITILSPNIDRMSEFSERIGDSSKNEEILLALITTFTDLEIDIDGLKALSEAQKYFGEIFDALQVELYHILTIVVKQGFKTQKLVSEMDDEYFENLKDSGIKEIDDLIKLREMMKKPK